MPETRSSQDLRIRNLDAVLNAVTEHGPRTRNAIAEATGLHKSSVSSLVDELTELGVLRLHAPRHEGTTGRPAAIVDLAPGAAAGLGVEVRADALVAHVSDLAGRPRYQSSRRAPHHVRRPEAVMDDLVALAHGALAEVARQQLRLSAITLALPGVLDAERGVLERFRQRLARPDLTVTADSSCSLAALAEGVADCLYVSGDDSISARLLVDGQLLRAPGFPDAFGHIHVEADGPRCRCGRFGCLEVFTRRAALLDAAGLGDGTFADLLEQARTGHPRALGAIAAAGHWLGVGLSSAVNLLAPPTIVLGGDFAVLAPWLLPSVEDELRARVFGRTPAWPSVAVAQLGPDAAARGAAAVATRSVDRLLRAV